MVAYYMRLSRSDGEEVSNSILEQRKVLEEFHSKNESLGGSRTVPFLPYHLEYIDDGYSGMNFKRPGWMKLIEDCKRGRVDTILVKDQSRIGRDYIAVEDYLNVVFPMLNIRVICITEDYDSKEEEEVDLMMRMEGLINTYYVRETSQKIKATQRNKWKRGLLASRSTPYGYYCDDLKEGWKIDEEAARIVRRIFEEKDNGRSAREIAASLNRDRVSTPEKRLLERGARTKSTGIVPKDKWFWDTSKVNIILQDESYTGVLLQGKRITILPGKGKVRKNDEPFRHENMHEPIVSRELYLRVNAGKEKKEPVRGTPRDYLFKGKVRCETCNRMMQWSNGRFSCPNVREFTGCSARKWKEDELKAAVLTQVRDARERAKQILENADGAADVKGLEEDVRREQESRVEKYREYCSGDISLNEFKRYRDESLEREAVMEAELSVTRGKKEWAEDQEYMLRPLSKVEDDDFISVVDTVYAGEEVRVKFKAERFLNKSN